MGGPLPGIKQGITPGETFSSSPTVKRGEEERPSFLTNSETGREKRLSFLPNSETGRREALTLAKQ